MARVSATERVNIVEFVEELDENCLTSFSNTPRTVITDTVRGLRLDMQNMTTPQKGQTRCYNLQVQANKATGKGGKYKKSHSSRKMGENGGSLALALVPSDFSWDPARIKQELMDSFIRYTETPDASRV